MGDKQHVIAAEDAVAEARRALTRSASLSVATLTEALGHEADHALARELLADYYADRMSEAELRGEAEDVQFFGELATAYDDGKHAEQLAGGGSLELSSDPPGRYARAGQPARK